MSYEAQFKKIQKRNFKLIIEADKKQNFYDYFFTYPSRVTSSKKPDSYWDDADVRLKFCLKCKRVWELTKYYTTHNYKGVYKRRLTKKLWYWQEITSRGKQRKICPLCSNKKVNQVFHW